MERHTREALREGLSTIDQLIDVADASDETKTHATKLFRKAMQSEEGIRVGRGITKVAATTVVLASRQTGESCDPELVASELGEHIEEKHILRLTRELQQDLDIGFTLRDPHDSLDAIDEALDLEEDLRNATDELIDIVVEDGTAAGKKADVIAASALYALSVRSPGRGKQGSYTQSEIANAAGISEVSIRNTYKDFNDTLSTGDHTIDSVSWISYSGL